MYSTIGAFEAKATLSALLQATKQGKKFTITVRGEPVADLVPSKPNVKAAIEALRTMKKIEGISPEDIKKWMTEGRK